MALETAEAQMASCLWSEALATQIRNVLSAAWPLDTIKATGMSSVPQLRATFGNNTGFKLQQRLRLQ